MAVLVPRIAAATSYIFAECHLSLANDCCDCWEFVSCATSISLGSDTSHLLSNLSLWLERFADARPDSFLFPCHKVGLPGHSRAPVLWDIDLDRPVGCCRKAWRLACKAAGVRYRPHDMQHTFISRLVENPNVSEQTIKELAGHVGRRMLERYSHIRSQAKQAAIQALQQQAIEPILQMTGHKIGHSAERTQDRS